MKSFKEFVAEQTVKAVKQGKTKKGDPVILAKLPNGNYHVMVQRTNYSRGKDVKSWVRVSPKANMPFRDEQEYLKTGEPDLKAAEKLFKKRATGGIVVKEADDDGVNVKAAKERIARERANDRKKFDRIMDRAIIDDAKAKALNTRAK